MPAKSDLEAIYALGRDSHLDVTAQIGIFGSSFPEPLTALFGLQAVHVTPATHDTETIRNSTVAPFLERFMDQHVRTFLHRLASGHFSTVKAIIFCRDEGDALVAYQYAAELRRLGVIADQAPRLILWNLVHSPTDAVSAFNNKELERLKAELTGGQADTTALATAVHDSNSRETGLQRLSNARALGALPSGTAMRWRNAGRFTSPRRHGQLLGQALDELQDDTPSRARIRIGLVGSHLKCPHFYDMIDSCGIVVADLQPWGDRWPLAMTENASPSQIITSAAGDASCHRIVPPLRYRQALIQQIIASGCNLVVCQLAEGDDSFGWEVPALQAELQSAGIVFVNLGFMQTHPTDAWLAEARSKIISLSEEAMQ